MTTDQVAKALYGKKETKPMRQYTILLRQAGSRQESKITIELPYVIEGAEIRRELLAKAQILIDTVIKD